jgi:flagellar hook-associated protein 2
MVSGMDTGSIINQLVAVEGNQQTLLKNQMTKGQSAVDALGKLISGARDLASQARSLATTSTWTGVVATSTSASVTAKATGSVPASLSFDVTSLASAHTVLSTAAASSGAAVVASGPITLRTSDGTEKTLEVGTGTLAEVVSALNVSGSGVRAAAVQTSPGSYRLQITSTATGKDSEFSVSGVAGLGDLNILSQGKDALLTVGKGSAAEYTATSPSNTFSTLMTGLSFTVSKLEDNVTVTSSVDGSGVADQVTKLVDAANSMLSDISKATAYDRTTKTGGPLLGDAAVRRLQQSLLDLAGRSSAAGVSVSTSGKLTFDRTKFVDAFAKDPQKVMKQFGASTTFTASTGLNAGVKLVRSGDTTANGIYPIKVTQSAAKEQWRADAPGGVPAGTVLELSRGTASLSYTVGDGEGGDTLVSVLNAQLSQKGLGIAASMDVDGSLIFTANSSGSGQAFTFAATGNGVSAGQVTAGRDIIGTINGITAVGTGETLRVPENSGRASGLALQVSVTDADLAVSEDIGSVNYVNGFAQSLLNVVAKASSSAGGLLVTAQTGRKSNVADLQQQVADWDRRLSARRATITKQFTAMESALSALKGQTSALSGLLSS